MKALFVLLLSGFMLAAGQARADVCVTYWWHGGTNMAPFHEITTGSSTDTWAQVVTYDPAPPFTWHMYVTRNGVVISPGASTTGSLDWANFTISEDTSACVVHSTPEMSDMLAVAFVVVSGCMVWYHRRRATT